MLKMILFGYFTITAFVMVFVTVWLFYAAVIEGNISSFIYGAGLDLFSCMIVFRKDAQAVQSVFISSIIIVVIVSSFVRSYRKIKTSKI